MPPKLTYEQKLYNNCIENMQANKWYFIRNKKDYERIIEFVKIFIDAGEPFEIKSDYDSIRIVDGTDNDYTPWHLRKKLPDGIMMVERGLHEEFETFTVPIVKKGPTEFTEKVPHHYEFYNENNILISTEIPDKKHTKQRRSDGC